ncbi:cytokine receptor isoform X1 [Octopus vulgaris]|uniref:Cytokine receptor isoform X1 n=1 Tax=Octopus vulgaris TaxID=6645 RepID=A0AA36BCK7_OCTVU|nr:cytokine receptor isoform X1 [Octopus vulgaris]
MLVLLVLLLFLPVTNSYDKLILEPNDPFVFVGDCITFTCKLNSTTLDDASALYFTNSSPNETTFNKTSASLKKCYNSSKEAGSFVCKYSNAQVHAGQWVKVEEKLVPIPKDSIKCIVFDWRILNCSWSLGQRYNYMDNVGVDFCWSYTLAKKCTSLQKSLTWMNLSRDEIDLTISLGLDFTVHYTYKETKYQQRTHIRLNASKPTQPSPVKNVHLNVNDTCVRMEWKHRYVYKLRFHIFLKEVNSKKLLNFSVEGRRFYFCKLNPFTKYELKIYALPKQNGIYSEPYVETFISHKSVPVHSPRITNGSFKRDISDVNSVTVFWKNLMRREFGDENVEYLIQNKNSNLTAFQNNLLLELSLNKTSCENIRIWAKNSVGYSKPPSSIRICDKSKVPDYPRNIEAIVLNSTTVWIKWESPKDNHTRVTRYTVYRCDKENHFRNCTWSYVNGNETSKNLSMNTDVNSYSFAVSAENDEGSSGLIWSPCLFILKKPENPVEFRVNAKDGTLIVEWDHYNCYIEKAYLTNYVVSYCVSFNKTNCKDKIQKRYISKKQKKYVIDNLPKDKYLVWVKSSTSIGDGPVMTREIQVNGETLPKSILWSIIGSMIIMLFIFGIIFIYVKRSKKFVDKIPFEYPGKTEDKYNSISSIMHVDTLSSCINDEAYDSSSVLITPKLCSEPSPESECNQMYLQEKTSLENDFKSKDINVQGLHDLQKNSSKEELTETVMDYGYKEMDLSFDTCDAKKQAPSGESNEDQKSNPYIRAVPSFTSMKHHDKDENSGDIFADFVIGKSDYVSNSSDFENICFGNKSYNSMHTNSVDKAVVQS